MKPTYVNIKPGDEVTWVMDSDYRDDFKVLEVFLHPHLTDDLGEPLLMARLKPLNPEHFCSLMLAAEHPVPPTQLRVEVPLAMLLPVVTRTVH
ncbi:TPA: hypothetical protein JG851_004775 [Vibrio parahaemolyticus]|nr:hypothetical protein [Vibrio parahaemolyticus]HBB9976772.1 hypothetical protein [Vibrio parahaemolyticus]HBC0013332.1 hypothetical protein [Vibrio parahaemolyticus]